MVATSAGVLRLAPLLAQLNLNKVAVPASSLPAGREELEEAELRPLRGCKKEGVSLKNMATGWKRDTSDTAVEKACLSGDGAAATAGGLKLSPSTSRRQCRDNTSAPAHQYMHVCICMCVLHACVCVCGMCSVCVLHVRAPRTTQVHAILFHHHTGKNTFHNFDKFHCTIYYTLCNSLTDGEARSSRS